MTIVPYAPQYWEDIQKVHDPARKQELELAGLDSDAIDAILETGRTQC